MTEQPSFNFNPRYGTEPRKLARTGDPETSHEAANVVDTTHLESLVHREICRRRECIAADLLAHFSGYPYSSITARFKALQDKGLISCGPDKRRGPSGRHQRVMRPLKEAAQ